jgi:hypothetical protein
MSLVWKYGVGAEPVYDKSDADAEFVRMQEALTIAGQQADRLERELADERAVSEGRRATLQVKADELAAEWRRAEQAEAQLADERAAHAVTQAERNAARRDMVAAMRAVCEDSDGRDDLCEPTRTLAHYDTLQGLSDAMLAGLATHPYAALARWALDELALRALKP